MSITRQENAVFKRRRWFQGRHIRGSEMHDIGWFTPGGEEMSEEDWNQGFAKSLGVFINGEGIAAPDSRGERIIGDSFYLIFNSHSDAMAFKLPGLEWGSEWNKIFDTFDETVPKLEEVFAAGKEVMVQSYSLVVMRNFK